MLDPQRVVAPDGVVWTVERKVLPWRPQRRLFRHHVDLPDGPSFGDFGGDDPVSTVLAIVALLLLVIVGVLLLGPAFGLLALGLEWVVALLIALGGVLLRLVLGWPFVVAATSDRGGRYEVRVGGWRSSGRVETELADRLRATGQPPGSGLR